MIINTPPLRLRGWHGMAGMAPVRWLARRWAVWTARRLLRTGALVIDTETTDFGGEIIEIAVIDARTDQVLFDSLVRPVGPIVAAATAVHGITDQDCAAAPAWPAVWEQLRPLLHRRPVVAFNAPFDRGRIVADCRRHHLKQARMRWTCLMRLDAMYRGGGWRTLESAGHGGGHRAKDDGLAAAHLLKQVSDHRR